MLTATPCDTEFMPRVADPKSVEVNVTKGTGVDIEWRDGHRSSYSFQFLRDACPCAMCDDERNRDGASGGNRARRQVCAALHLERRPSARHLFLATAARFVPLRRVQSGGRISDWRSRPGSDDFDAPFGVEGEVLAWGCSTI